MNYPLILSCCLSNGLTARLKDNGRSVWMSSLPLQFPAMYLQNFNFAFIFILLLGLITACERPSDNPTTTLGDIESNAISTPFPTPTLANTPLATTVQQETAVSPTDTPTATITPTPFFTGGEVTPCGQLLPILPQNSDPAVSVLSPNDDALAALQAAMPEVAHPALAQLLANPDDVGLVAFRVGDEANGIYHNANMQMPLASVVKIVHLVAYAEAVAAGQLDPTSYVTLETLEQYYLPGYDLGSHNDAVEELAENGLVLAAPDRIRLEDVPWMMMRHSANAATDYLHTLLGQELIEQTAVSLNLTQQTAPCTFLGQFLAMGNQTRQTISDRDAIITYIENPSSYGTEVVQLAELYATDTSFREVEQAWHQELRRPSSRDQRYFSHFLNAHGTPQEYANLMAQIAQNGLTNAESSFLTRRYLEWPMIFPTNQERFSNLGYKNGSLPGILNTAYYAYPLGEVSPTVVILFFQNLPGSNYRTWRNSLAHDEFARWLLDNPEGLALLKAVVSTP